MPAPSTPPRVLIPLAAGFEEIEAVTLIDVLRRAGAEVTVAGLAPGPVLGSHGITVVPDRPLAGLEEADFESIALPGGMPGAAHLRDDARLQGILRRHHGLGRRTAAICAAPMALGPSGISAGRTVTSYPGFGDRFPHGAYLEDRVVVDGPVTTSRGPGTALEFALALVRSLLGETTARSLADAMLLAPGLRP